LSVANHGYHVLLGKEIWTLSYQCDYDEGKALQIALSVADFHTEGRNAFHPVDLAASYYTQIEAAKVAAAKFAEGRLVSWLNHFERVLAANKKQSGFFVGENMT